MWVVGLDCGSGSVRHSPPVNEIPRETVSNLLNEGGMATSPGHVARGLPVPHMSHNNVPVIKHPR